METWRYHKISFKCAFEGLFYAFRTQPNFKIHFLLSALALGAGFYLQISRLEMILLVLVIIIGLTVEMANTAFESFADLVTSEWKREIKIAKDVSAGMMLLTAIGAVIVALLIFLPHIFEKIGL